ncbi:SPOSA6832_03629, partial [Sporobolomyces salmonicolor]
MPPPSAWSPPRAKVQLKLAIQRLRLLAQKKTQLAKATRREIAQQLEKGRIESASIKCEGIMSEDLYVELLEVLELYCELLLARFGLLETVKEIDPGVNEAVAGIIHAAPRTELKELHVLREMLMSKGGRDYSIACVDNVDGIVPDRVTAKLVVSAPPQELIDLYLYEIAKAYSVDWRPQGFPDPNAPVDETESPSISLLIGSLFLPAAF